jgi:hypothetical protein
MTWKTILISTGIALGALSPAWGQSAVSQPTNNCDAGDKIDASTADSARQKMQAAGYTDISDLFKGCDNVWHGKARSNGNAVNVMVAPDGSVHQETN